MGHALVFRYRQELRIVGEGSLASRLVQGNARVLDERRAVHSLVRIFLEAGATGKSGASAGLHPAAGDVGWIVAGGLLASDGHRRDGRRNEQSYETTWNPGSGVHIFEHKSGMGDYTPAVAMS